MVEPENKLAKTHEECLAVMCAILFFGIYLEKRQITVRTEHETLKCIHTITETTGKLPSRRLCLLGLDFNVVLCVAVKHEAADALSRLKTGGCDT